MTVPEMKRVLDPKVKDEEDQQAWLVEKHGANRKDPMAWSSGGSGQHVGGPCSVLSQGNLRNGPESLLHNQYRNAQQHKHI